MERPIRTLEASLGALRRQFGLAEPAAAATLRAAWRSLVGDSLDGITASVEVRAGALHVVVTDPSAVEAVRWKAVAVGDDLRAAVPGTPWDDVVVRSVAPHQRSPGGDRDRQ